MKLLLVILALAVQSGPELTQDEEARAQDLMREVRCMVCAGQSVGDSDAGMARDMRLFIRERVEAGQSDGEIRDALVQRFGHEVLLRPRLDARTAPLWIAPALFLVLGGVLLFTAMRKRT